MTKHSGVPWLGELPEQWEVVRLKFLCAELQTGPFGSQLHAEDYVHGGVPVINPAHILEGGIVPGDGITVDDSTAERLAIHRMEPGDLIFARRGEMGRCAIISEGERGWLCGTGSLRARLRYGRVLSTYLLKVFGHPAVAETLKGVSVGSTMDNLNTEILGNLAVPLPSLPEQRAISDFLDRETAEIDALIAAKERLIGILAEKRRAVIAHAVTRGLDPGVPMKDSGVAWLGEIPAHWELERARWLFQERDERSETGEEEMLTVSHLTGVTPRSEKDVNMFEAESNEGYKLCCAGDLVINTLWAWMGAMGVARVPGLVSPAYNVYTPGDRLTADYVDALVRVPAFAAETTRHSKGVWSSRLRLYPEGLWQIWMPVPPLHEQQAIVAHIATETAKLDRLRAAAERTIRLLKERRSALIAEAVTGKLEVSA